MTSYNIFTNEEDSLPSGKADFLLAASVTGICTLEGITQSDAQMISLMPTLDAEFIANEKVFSSSHPAETPNGVPTPSIITRAVHNVIPFKSIEILNLGLNTAPQNSTCHNFDILPSKPLTMGSGIDARAVFAKGLAAGKSYELKGNYLILAEGTPGGTITAAATALALGYNCADDFSSNFLNIPCDIKEETIQKALSLIHEDMDTFEILSLVGDNMLIFCAGFLMEASRRFHVVLAGGTQMAACLLVADRLREDVLMRVKDANITLATTLWIANDSNSNIKHLLSLLSFTPHAVYTDFSFADAQIQVLHQYDEGAIKDGAGAGGALAYAAAHHISNKKLLESIEHILYLM
ncbi:nicotinate-nucleotide--dimethylbenzimidazole phosphoribosyltransferase [bacterium]|nr:nicotinate-nucleotide--dimethylbenzimidazole phosphoribosyltransferase [bacterium]MBU1989874.1 nicotinate-nucleotide--dimethylbenzimidazole phosphoribosyltransferase [bacterium]